MDALSFRCVPRPNDFDDFAEYHICKVSPYNVYLHLTGMFTEQACFYRQTIVVAMSHIRDERGNPFPQIQQFLIDLLTYNDNAKNTVSPARRC